MSRTLCLGCQRPQKACICTFIADIPNDIHVVVLQHPSEVSQTKGTVALLAKSLQSCQVIVGENFDEEACFLKLMEQYQLVLLYPGEKAQTLNQNFVAQLTHLDKSNENIEDATQFKTKLDAKPLGLIILDGTWKKAYRMFMLSTKLQQLPQVCLPDYLANAGQYLIRKVAKKNALSSLEASCYALALLEQSTEQVYDSAAQDYDAEPITPEHAGKYQPLLEKFKQFNQFQLSFRPANKALKET
ncbi:tRNA-uridine aminocarboxypropyltransferase [Colwellia psychrerythraea]|uniref:tRNA-uridine aminocarboxypropyltransferase n=1 Tax=Colwellia psychrerythraea (strain 34H / ATCC BAA-681) TaxID=167879 RepID=Q482Z3_COLP3|nr:tRNA-uridine aminocarboxypropyltransferase [Colwellia psychrerythraea]AAZ28330.1 DTW domain protein [Colwellia psychrerythraea 34H]